MVDAAAGLSALAHQELESAETSLRVVQHQEGHFLDPSQRHHQTRIKALRENWLRLNLLLEVVEAWVLAAAAEVLHRQVHPRSLLVRNALDVIQKEVVDSSLLHWPRQMQ